MSLEKTCQIFFVFLLTTLVSVCPSQGADKSFTMLGHRITDQSGNEIIVNTPFKRVVSLYGAHTENLFSLGCTTQIIGVLPRTHYPPKARHLPAFHYREGAEKFLAARPDLVLIRPMIARGYPRLVEKLRASGISVISVQPGNIEEMFLYWRILGLLTGHEEQAEAMVNEFQKTVTDFRAASETINPKKRVFFESIHSKMKTFAPDSMAIFALECAGGINLAKDAVPARKTNIADFGKERILALGSQIDVYLAQVGPMNRPTIAAISDEAGFHIIKAIQTGDIHLIDETMVSRPTMRLLEGITTIGRILYPDRFIQAQETPKEKTPDGQ
ncbi:MAG: ABC transporter substrate-binding protein [Deltaproteobacteria bacterium]|nr:ABC transporter substrate-binding protein [Deltaproteobacteria bacterium]